MVWCCLCPGRPRRARNVLNVELTDTRVLISNKPAMEKSVFDALKDALRWHGHPCIRSQNSEALQFKKTVSSITEYSDNMMISAIHLVATLKGTDVLYGPLIRAILKHDAYEDLPCFDIHNITPVMNSQRLEHKFNQCSPPSADRFCL